MVVGAKVCDLTEDLLWFVCGNFDVSPKAALMVYKNMLLPMLEYGDVFLSATTNVNRKRLQTL